MSDKNNISDAELSLISAISGLDNKLEELDHNISFLSKQTRNSTDNTANDKELNDRISTLERKIIELGDQVSRQSSTEISNQYLNTFPTKGRFSGQKKRVRFSREFKIKEDRVYRKISKSTFGKVWGKRIFFTKF